MCDMAPSCVCHDEFSSQICVLDTQVMYVSELRCVDVLCLPIWRGGGLGSRPIFKFNEPYAPS